MKFNMTLIARTSHWNFLIRQTKVHSEAIFQKTNQPHKHAMQFQYPRVNP